MIKHFEKVLVQQSENYSILKKIPFNRPSGIKETLRASLRRHGMIDEIKVVKTSIFSEDGTKDLRILDAQNRFDTLMAMREPFDYIIEAETDSKMQIAQMIRAYNTARDDWKSIDHVNLYEALQIEDYVRLKKIMANYPFVSVRVAANLLRRIKSRSSGAMKLIKEGTFTITSEEYALAILDEIKTFADIKIKGKNFHPDQKFITAFSDLYSNFKPGEYKRIVMIDVIRTMLKAEDKPFIGLTNEQSRDKLFINYKNEFRSRVGKF